ncbi:hypothetical protein F5Y11DRAFT_332492 [Daldinia sp. FL1419]|nr:hypothetical protein F5Y11DRAFT_332492 [Daldinia sp. FL1419]
MESGRPTPPPPWEPLPNWYDTKLEDILPHDGFVFPEGYKIFKIKQDWVRIKWAIEAPAPTLAVDKVDEVLAAIMNDANIIAIMSQQTHDTYIDYSSDRVEDILERARKEHSWTEIVPDGRFPHLLKKLIQARALYNQITSIIGRSEDEKSRPQGKLATAIDRWIHSSPTDEPDVRYAEMPQFLQDFMIKDMIDKEFEDCDSKDDSTDTNTGTGTDEEGSDEDLGDEDAPWVHTNYMSNGEHTPRSAYDEDDEDDENAPWIPWSQTRHAHQLSSDSSDSMDERRLMLYRT